MAHDYYNASKVGNGYLLLYFIFCFICEKNSHFSSQLLANLDVIITTIIRRKRNSEHVFFNINKGDILS